MEDTTSNSEDNFYSEELLEETTILLQKILNGIFNTEKNNWENYIFKYYIYIPKKCPICSLTIYSNW